jgi:hypothetical protein
MKAINSIRQYLPVVIFSLALMATSIEVSSQNRRNNNKSDKNSDRKEYRNNRQYQPSARNADRNSDREEYGNDRSYRQDQSTNRNDYRNRDGRSYERQNSGRNNGNYEYNQRYSRNSNYSRSNYYDHPRYGRVYQQFDHNPVVFRHPQGNYYYSGNNFYTYRRGIGYYVVEPPRDVYFRDLPFECERIHSHGQVYYRNGDLFFSYSPRGYVIVPSPFQVNFSLRF